MPDAGVPRSSVPVTGITSSHTATQQWQSFEIRMRQRRAERCRLRAESAIDEGALDDAQEALDEARRLQPDLPGLLVAEERLVEARIPRVTTQPAARRTSRTLIAAASIALVAGLGALIFSGRPFARLRPTPVLSTAPSPVATFSNPVEQAAPTIDRPMLTQPGDAASNRTAQADALVQTRVPASAAEPQPQPEVPAEPAVEPSQPLVTAAPAIVIPAPEPRSTTTTALKAPTTPTATETPPEAVPAPLPALAPEHTIPVPPPATSLPPPPTVTSVVEAMAGSPVALGTAASPAPSSDAESVEQPAAEEHVRAALARYEAAYNSLNAAGARAVWPTVDARALARAFDSLHSQHVSLGNCTIAVSGDGRSARASCAGTATWTPKVGGGTRTAPRTWLFQLQPNGDRWQIARATTR